MDIQKILAARTIREFKEEAIPEEDWQDLLTVAQQAVSSQGRQLWRLLQLDDAGLRQKIALHAPGMTRQLATADKFIFFIAKKGIERDEHIDRLAGAIGIFTEEGLDGWLARQTFIPLGQMLLAAGQIGIQACAMEGFDRFKIEALLIKQDLLQADEQLVVAAAFGYQEEAAKGEKVRKSLGDLFTKY
ncbi:nitroreductase family protein [Lactococcus termiticola]|uniref:Putative NAD(P)H-flavin oxidoreductase n=1 Tax=Lactococcus termiticola TaxID=2169526 RepID=A0A2R5HJ75_9LACT|nr:nitroreductase family protein [Lactococcus termiticola]GBG96570.1 putative NAD(P)H-flavin oxidoreductase [Lactococcus termiticola]